EDPLIGRALTNVAETLAIRAADETPLTVQVLGADPGQTELLGRLWAQLLRSWPHRVVALDELHTVCAQLADTSRAALGAAIHRQMSPLEWQWLCRDLGIQLAAGTDVLEAAR